MAQAHIRTESSPSSLASSRAAFIQARLSSILSLVPLGVWVFIHLWHNLSAFQGASAWESSVTEYAHPWALFGTTCLVMIPLVWHTIWGLTRLASVRQNVQKYPFFNNLKYVLQRLAGVGLLFFLPAHLWLAMIHPRVVEGRAEPFQDIAHEMHFHTPTLVVYVLGVLAIAYHLANGIHTASWGLGLIQTRQAVHRWQGVAWVAFVVLLLMGWGAVYGLWQAGGSL